MDGKGGGPVNQEANAYSFEEIPSPGTGADPGKISSRTRKEELLKKLDTCLHSFKGNLKSKSGSDDTLSIIMHMLKQGKEGDHGEN